MLENIPNNSMYTTIPPIEDISFFDDDVVDYNFEPLDTSFIENEDKEMEDLIKHEPSRWYWWLMSFSLSKSVIINLNYCADHEEKIVIELKV